MTKVGTTIVRRTRLSRDERRELFLDIAARIVVEHGVEALTMEGLAAEAGVSKALGYRYFTNRDDLLAALFERETRRYDQRINERTSGLSSFEDRIRAMLETYLDTVTERGNVLTILMQARLGGGAFEQRRRERNRYVEDYFAALIHEEFGVPAATALVASSVFLTGTLGLITAWLDRGLPRDEVTATFVELCSASLRGLASR
ncbi:TetR/AcrR family transcriptional regulator [Rhabdothermincola sp.]|uniref:TetR/AcrR family transcriptional regulator n=1 Tax=Rhabdothermincola sp. TaxID=2820405 RepID=UPI002FE3C0F1